MPKQSRNSTRHSGVFLLNLLAGTRRFSLATRKTENLSKKEPEHIWVWQKVGKRSSFKKTIGQTASSKALLIGTPEMPCGRWTWIAGRFGGNGVGGLHQMADHSMPWLGFPEHRKFHLVKGLSRVDSLRQSGTPEEDQQDLGALHKSRYGDFCVD